MWEILFGYGLEKIFGKQTAAFEIGGEIVQTSVPGNASPQAVGKATLEPTSNIPITPELVCYAPESVYHRPGIQIGFNPFTPIIVKGAQEFIEAVGYDPMAGKERY